MYHPPTNTVVVAGGTTTGGAVTATTEAYNPTNHVWLARTPMPGGLARTAGVLLFDDDLFIAGGFNGDAVDTAFRYDPSGNAWTTITGGMIASRMDHAMALLPDGRVLISGGAFSPAGEIFDPTDDSFTATTGGAANRQNHTATVLQDGRVLLAGGGYAGDVYSPATGTWTATAPRFYGLVGGAALAVLPNGQVLSVGGAQLANCSPKGCGSEPRADAELYTP